MSRRVGADIGGTFTDLVLTGDDGKSFQIEKVLTTPDRPDDAVVAGISGVLKSAEVAASTVSQVIHGTTLFTNALIERKGAKTALITTKGFRDAIEIAREHRYDMYDLRMQRPKPLAPRNLRFELNERILFDGSVHKALDEEEVRILVEKLKRHRVEAVGVCLIHSYINNSHERRAAEILAESLPDVAVTISSELVPVIREYDRTSTTLANIYVKRIAENYLNGLSRRLSEELDIHGELLIMQSNGGVCELNTAAKFPIRLVESGPAAGALAAAYYGMVLGHKDLLSFDMGGTTAKSCVIVNGEPLITPEFEIDRQYQFKKGSGFPVKVPVIGMIEIGTGGGSIARVDAMRRLQVGPDSAGAEPGPVCYGLGGSEPTVTDADLMLGYLDPAFFLGGRMTLDHEGAEKAIKSKIGTPLNLDAVQAAWGIHQLANESMASAARVHAVERGQNIARFPIFAFGGAGPVHAFGVARILRSPRVIYPMGAGVMSAVGFLTAPLSFDFVRTAPGALDDLDWGEVFRIVGEMEAEGRETLGRTMNASDRVRFRRYGDMRYRKQGYEIRVPIPDGKLDASSFGEIKENFEEVYESQYGHISPNTQIEVVAWRVVAYGPDPDLSLPKIKDNGACDARKGTRAVYLPDENRYVDVPVYDRYMLPPGASFEGPAIVEERESTAVICGHTKIHTDEFGNLIVDIPQPA